MVILKQTTGKLKIVKTVLLLCYLVYAIVEVCRLMNERVTVRGTSKTTFYSRYDTYRR